MEQLKYKVIASEKQYDKYCATLEELIFSESRNSKDSDEISLLTQLIKKWDADHNIFHEPDLQ